VTASLRVAAVQFAPAFERSSRNLTTAVQLVTQAIREGARLITLPELCTTGYSFMDYEHAARFAEDLSGPETSSSMAIFKEICHRYEVAIAYGTPERDPGTHKLYNSQVLITPNLWCVYRKANMWANDYLWATEGSEPPSILEFCERRVGTLICRDIRDRSDDVDSFYEKGDADIVCFSSNFGKGGFPAVSWIRFAKNNKVWLLVSNRYGLEQNNDFGHGGICIVSPEGQVSCRGLKWNQPCVVTADIP
jgi:predicted amidohydrolase